MGWPVQPLLFFLGRCTRNQLIRQIEFLRAENELLRKRLPKRRIRITLDEQKTDQAWDRRRARTA